MNADKELDRLDKLVAEAMGWPITEVPPGQIMLMLVVDEDLWGQSFVLAKGTIRYLDHVWSPTRNAADRDVVVKWLWKTKHFQVAIDYYPIGYAGDEDIADVVNVEIDKSDFHFCSRDYETPGEAVCRVIEILVKQVELE